MDQGIGFIARFTGGVIALAGMAFGLGRYNSTVVKKKEIYKPDGSPIYLTVNQSKENIADCRNAMAKEIEITHKKLDKITDFLKERNDRDLEMMEFVGQVKGYMANQNRS